MNYLKVVSKKKILLLTLSISLSLLVACNSDYQSSTAPFANAEQITPTLTDNLFAVDLFKTICKLTDDENALISPLSVSMALSMALNGADGATPEEIKDAIRAKNYSLEDINAYNTSLRDALLTVDNAFELKVQDAAKQINNKIDEIVKKVPDNALMYIINAIYFKGIWSQKFDRRRKASHSHDSGNANLNYFDDEYCKYLMLPYGSKEFSMVIMLPNEDRTIDEVILSLDCERWGNAITQMSGKKANLRFPCFKVDCEHEMQKSILREMGIETPSSPTGSDFNIFNDSNEISISKVIHKTHIEVDKEGLDATAATSLEFIYSSDSRTHEIADYMVNKPFVFAVRENATGVILFIGKIENG